MDVEGYRNSGELSDITVVVDGEEFHLHKFPLFVRSSYFKNMSQSQSQQSQQSASASADKKTRIELKQFPGGVRNFALIADYCYNKDVKVTADNVVVVRCAAEYLEMKNGAFGQGGLAAIADNLLYNVLDAARLRKDYQFSLLLLSRAAEHVELAEKCDLQRKLIDSFAENLSKFVLTSPEFVGLRHHQHQLHIHHYHHGGSGSSHYQRCTSKSSRRCPSTAATATATAKQSNLANLLNEKSLKMLNKLPLDWMNELIKFTYRNALNSSVLTHIIKNYIDYNTGLDKLSPQAAQAVADAPPTSSSSTDDSSSNQQQERKRSLSELTQTNLLAVAADLASRIDEQQQDEKTKRANLVRVAGEILDMDAAAGAASAGAGGVDQARINLVRVASEILDMDPAAAAASAGGVDQARTNLVRVASEILDMDPAAAAAAGAGGVDLARTNLVRVASEILEMDAAAGSAAPSTSAGASGAGSALKPNSLIDVMREVMSSEKKSANLLKIASQIMGRMPSNNDASSSPTQQQDNAGAEALPIVEKLVNTLADLRIETDFPIPWLFTYVDAMHRLGADPRVKLAFHNWIWSALQSEPSEHNLSAIRPSVMGEMLKTVTHDLVDVTRLIALLDQYVNDLDREKKLNPDNFLSLVSAIPNEKRTTMDSLVRPLLNLLENEHERLSAAKQKELIDKLDFSKLNESSLEACDKSAFIPSKHVSEAALALCSKLRKELDNAHFKIRLLEANTCPVAAAAAVAAATATTTTMTTATPCNITRTTLISTPTRRSLAAAAANGNNNGAASSNAVANARSPSPSDDHHHQQTNTFKSNNNNNSVVFFEPSVTRHRSVDKYVVKTHQSIRTPTTTKSTFVSSSSAHFAGDVSHSNDDDDQVDGGSGSSSRRNRRNHHQYTNIPISHASKQVNTSTTKTSAAAPPPPPPPTSSTAAARLANKSSPHLDSHHHHHQHHYHHQHHHLTSSKKKYSNEIYFDIDHNDDDYGVLLDDDDYHHAVVPLPITTKLHDMYSVTKSYSKFPHF